MTPHGKYKRFWDTLFVRGFLVNIVISEVTITCLLASRYASILMSCHSFSAAKEAICMLYINSGDSLQLHNCVLGENSPIFLCSVYNQKYTSSPFFFLGIFWNVTVEIATDILQPSSSTTRQLVTLSSSTSDKVNFRLGMFSNIHQSFPLISSVSFYLFWLGIVYILSIVLNVCFIRLGPETFEKLI